ncbi:MAG: hypothetical protein KC503_46440 [Myxococcales bacterium]|nr:hypothetical protein [Myxococcales bacterium]
MNVAARAAGQLMREVYRRELLPARARWWIAAAGMRDWFRYVARSLEAHVEGEGEGDGGASREARARAIVCELAAETMRRRYAALREGEHAAALPAPEENPRAVALLMSALYRLDLSPRGARWIFDGLGGGPHDLGERLAAQRLAWPLSSEQRWRELTVHLGEWLIVLTERLPERLPRARQIIAEICFDAGVRYARSIRRWFSLPADNDAARAIEVLRTSEYVFRVNPEHWGDAAADGRSGYLEGNACPWYDRPGWQRMHCGIFGQFQAGVCSEFNLKYKLTKTIPKHGGKLCRVDLVS